MAGVFVVSLFLKQSSWHDIFFHRHNTVRRWELHSAHMSAETQSSCCTVMEKMNLHFWYITLSFMFLLNFQKNCLFSSIWASVTVNHYTKEESHYTSKENRFNLILFQVLPSTPLGICRLNRFHPQSTHQPIWDIRRDTSSPRKSFKRISEAQNQLGCIDQEDSMWNSFERL